MAAQLASRPTFAAVLHALTQMKPHTCCCPGLQKLRGQEALGGEDLGQQLSVEAIAGHRLVSAWPLCTGNA